MIEPAPRDEAEAGEGLPSQQKVLRHGEITDQAQLLEGDGDAGALCGARFLYLTTKAERSYANWAFAADDCLVFGPETRGLPEELLRANRERCLTIPMLNPKVRSLNLATSVAVVLYEALRQTGALEGRKQ